MKTEKKEHKDHLDHIYNLLVRMGEALDHAQEKGWVSENLYDVFKGFNDSSKEEVIKQRALLEGDE